MTAQLSREPIYQVQCLAGWIDTSKQCYQAEHEAGRPARILYTAPPAPVAVPDEMYWQDAPVEGSARAAAYATGWNACRAAMLKAGPVTAATVPLTRLDLAIFEACKHFLLCSDGSGKKYDGIFYDPETELSFSIYELAEKLGIVKCTGNRCWSLLPQVSDEIDAVYRKYALLMLAAAPAAPEQEV